MRQRAKVDGNQKEIVFALRSIGASVQSLATIGNGCPDLLVGYKKKNYLMEIKMPKGHIENDQLAFCMNWTGDTIYFVRSIEQALEVIGVSQSK